MYSEYLRRLDLSFVGEHLNMSEFEMLSPKGIDIAQWIQ